LEQDLKRVSASEKAAKGDRHPRGWTPARPRRCLSYVLEAEGHCAAEAGPRAELGRAQAVLEPSSWEGKELRYCVRNCGNLRLDLSYNCFAREAVSRVTYR